VKKLSYSQLAKKFEKTFDPSYENKALHARGTFISRFSINKLKEMKVDDYVVGKGKDSFCAFLETKTRAWAYIEGATAYKFGIYYGVTKSQPTNEKYRFTLKFGTTEKVAFTAVKKALIDLVAAGKNDRYSEIDKNPLSQMFKAKILSFYFPEKFINICSRDHLKEIALQVGIKEQGSTSKYQHLLIEQKNRLKRTRKWSNPKFMRFLYATYMPGHLKYEDAVQLTKPDRPKRSEPDFDELAKNWKKIGIMSEKFARRYEKDRLIGLGYANLVNKIKDCRQTPSCGYDFLSHTSPDVKRFIEVKTVRKDKNGDRFFMSANQEKVSKSKDHRKEYYFYLVSYGTGNRPENVYVMRSDEIYAVSTLVPIEYAVRFAFS